MREAVRRYTDSLALWSVGLTLGQSAVLAALWMSQDDPYASEPVVSLPHAELAELAKVKTGTVEKYLRQLDRLGAITRVRRRPGGRVVGYQLHHHVDAIEIVRPVAPVLSEHEQTTDRRASRRGQPKAKPPRGIRRDQIATVLESLPGVRANLPYSGRGGWMVQDAIEAMAEHRLSLADLDSLCRNYCDDARDDKPPPDKLFSGSGQRRETVERYGPTPAEQPTAPSRCEAKPVMARERWLAYFERLSTRDEAERIVSEHGEAIEAMDPDGVKAAVTAWKARRDGTPLVSIFAEGKP